MRRETRRDVEFDIVIFGATGFTGQLVAERLAERTRDTGVRWALAGRDRAKLVATRASIGAVNVADLIVADAGDPETLATMAARTGSVIATAGPYQVYGSNLVAACADAGTDYLDLSGETAWMRQMIEAHAATAERSGARILFSCGFDSVPFDLGIIYLQDMAAARFGGPVPRAKGRVRAMVGRFSGGTAASGRATGASAREDSGVARLLNDPFCLTPGFSGPSQPDRVDAAYDEDIGEWIAPFVMAPINTRNIHRSNALLGHRWGRNFVYDEAIVAGPGPAGEVRAKTMLTSNPLGDDAKLQPGQGPSAAERHAGWYDLLFIGHAGDGRQARVCVTGDRDPGYGSTARMIVEATLCLMEDGQTVGGGIWTPGAALGFALIDRLQQHAGLAFRAEEVS